MVPGPSLARHASQHAVAMETVSRIAPVRDHTAGEVALVTRFRSKLRNTGFVTVRKLKAWRRTV
ncbi:hypothetical protein PO909_008761 [Leuciscus waleckii]